MSAFAVDQLRRMGWTEGSGLGKRSAKGIVEPIQVQKRAEQAGLGTDPEKEAKREQLENIQDQWWLESVGNTLAKLSGNNNNTTKNIPTDEDLFAATGGARFGMRARKKRTVMSKENCTFEATTACSTGQRSRRKKRQREEETSAEKQERKRKKREKKKEKKRQRKDKKQER